MKIPKYFIWRLTEKEPWRVYGTKHHFPSYPPDLDCGQLVAWEGDDYQVGLFECRRLNQERKIQKIISDLASKRRNRKTIIE